MGRKETRFSLRTLLVLMTIGPPAAYWLAQPTLNAQRYAAALAMKEYAVADRMCVDQKHCFPGPAKGMLSFAAQAKVERLSWQDVWRGERRMVIYHQAHIGSLMGAFVSFEAVATRRGILFPDDEEKLLGIELPGP